MTRRTLVRVRLATLAGALAAPLGGCDGMMILEPFGFAHAGGWSAPPTVLAPPAAIDRSAEAWHLLARRSYSAALEIFHRQMSRCPGEGAPIVGAALATAGAGDLDGGVELMRGAIRVDPAALGTVPMNRFLRWRLEELAARYEDRLEWRGANPDDMLMLGALAHLAGKHEAARAAVMACRRLGDHSASVTNLGALAGVPESPRLARAEAPASAGPPAPALAASLPDLADAGPTPKPVLVVDEPSAVSEGAAAPPPLQPVGPPETTVPEPPLEPVDYDALRRGILEMSDTLERFNKDLQEALARNSS